MNIWYYNKKKNPFVFTKIKFLFLELFSKSKALFCDLETFKSKKNNCEYKRNKNRKKGDEKNNLKVKNLRKMRN